VVTSQGAPPRFSSVRPRQERAGRSARFCLINTPAYYHTDHDTLDKISAEGIGNAVRFHMRLLEGLHLIGRTK
jgi:hypothetical protein